jgi:hypothetical protein
MKAGISIPLQKIPAFAGMTNAHKKTPPAVTRTGLQLRRKRRFRYL